MEMRNFGLAAAFMLAATAGAGAQDLPDKGSNAPSKTERMPSESSGGKDSGSMGSEESSKGGQRAQEGRDRSAQDSGSERGGASNDAKQRKQSDRASGESKKSNDEASKPDQTREKSAQGNKQRDDKAAESKSDTNREKAASESKTHQGKSTADRGKQDDKSDSSSGTSSGEAGSSASGKLTEDKKKIDEVKKVQVTGERRDRLQSAFKSHGDVKHETNVDVNISIGSRAPRSWAFAPVPVAVIDVVPEYRGYVFAYAGDNYVVCDPDTYEVVAVLPASGSGGTYAAGGTSGASARCSTSLSLNEEDREAILRSLEIRDEVDVSGVSVGWSVPGDVELRTFPSAVVERRSELGACRYFVTDQQIAIVDPDQDKVVLLIEQK